MEILKNADRQYPLSAELIIAFDDGLTGVADNVVQDLLKLPINARVTGGEIVVEEVWDTATTHVADIGDVTDPNRYAAAVNLKALGRTALLLDGFKTTSVERTVDIDPTAVGADATQGRAYIRVEYVVENKAHETVGFDVADYGSKNAPETP